jgi:hypothetical protein
MHQSPFRSLNIHQHEAARQCARELAKTEEFAKAQRQRKKVEALFAELKNQIGLRRLRLRRLKFVREQFFLAAAAQNIKRLVRFLHGPRSVLPATTYCADGRDGKELYYIARDDKMMAVPVKSTATTFEPGSAVALFETHTRGYVPYDVAADGRFLINTVTEGVADSSPITVVLNWTAGLRK